MSVHLKIALGATLTIAALVTLIVVLTRVQSAPPGPSEERLATRLDRTSVQFHLALRARLAEEGASYAERLGRAPSDPQLADAMARELLDDLESNRPSPTAEPVLHHFGGSELSPAMDRLHVVLAMLWSERHPAREDRIPGYALLQEARSLEPEQLDASYAGLASAAKAYAHAAGGYCELVEPMVEDASREVPATQMAAWIDDDADSVDAAATLGRLQGLLVDGSLACCAMRSERLDHTAARLEQSIEDAERLGVCEKRLPLLRAWAALLQGRRDDARNELEGLDLDQMHEDDREPHRIIRSALAIEGEDAATRALVGTTRVEWLSRLVVAGALEAVEESALADALRTGETPRAAQRFIEGEAAIIDAARTIDPFFEQDRMTRAPRAPGPVPGALELTPWR